MDENVSLQTNSEEPCKDKEVIPYVCGHESNYLPVSGCSLCPPVSIKITVPPDKLIYYDGEDISIDGAIVRTFKANGNLWGGFPHGIIPHNQLTLDPDVAHGAEVVYPQALPSGASLQISSVGDQMAVFEDAISRMYTYQDDTGVIPLMRSYIEQYPNNPIQMYVVSNHANWEGWSPLIFDIFTGLTVGSSVTVGNSYSAIRIRTYGASKSDYNTPWRFTNKQVDSNPTNAVVGVNTEYGPDTIYPKYRISSIDAEYSGTSTITVSWDYQGNIMTDTFNIEVE